MWVSDLKPHEDLSRWGTSIAQEHGVTREVKVVPVVDGETCLIKRTRELVEIWIDAALLCDKGIQPEHLHAVIAHEIGEADIRIDYDEAGGEVDAGAVTGKELEHASDEFAAKVVGCEVAIEALRRVSASSAARGNPLRTDSTTHPTLEERIAHIERFCGQLER